MLRCPENNKLLYVLGLAIFLAFVRYKGYDFDAVLYLLQVINYLQPERFVNDVPFMFGNQDSFSLFSPMIAAVFKLLGVNVGGIVATLFLQVALGSAIITLVHKWCKLANVGNWAFPVILLMFALLANKEYGPDGFYLPMFESVLVARLASEVLIVVGLAFLFHENWYISIILFALASLMHPLMGGWALLLWLFFHFPKFRGPVIALAILSPLSGFLHIGRLDFYPNDWNPIFFRPGWNDILLYLGLLFFWVAMYRHFREGSFARFSLDLFWVSIIGFYLQFAGSYMEHVFLFQVQPFRVQWLCTIPVIPVFSVFVRDCLVGGGKFTLRECAGFMLGLCAIAGCQWAILLVVCVVFLFSTVGNRKVTEISALGTKVLFILSFVFLLGYSMLGNFVQLAVEQGIGNMDLAVSWMRAPAYAAVIENIVLFILALICFLQKKFGYALMFAVAFGCGSLKILPLVGLLLCLLPGLGSSIKRGLLAFSISCSFFELLSSLYISNSTQMLPLENAAFASVLLFLVLFAISYWILTLKNDDRCRNVLVPFLVLLVSLSAWDVYRWDSRNEIVALNEKQMDDFFETPIFPQVENRGQLLFTVDYESPIQSRVNFLTGAYADESINVGEVFYREQFFESNRRRSALLTGTSQVANLEKFSERIMNVYHNPDTLLSRVLFLCGTRDIAYFVTDYANMRLLKQDSIYLSKKQKFVWLYGCPGD